MRTLRELTGMPVVSGGKRIGRVIQGALSRDLRRLDGIWISAGPRGSRYIPSESLEMLGRVAVMADGAGQRQRVNAKPLFTRAVSTDGRRLGAITGAEIDEITFAVTALELSAGVWDDLMFKRSRVTRYTVNRESGEVVIDIANDNEEARTDEERHVEGPDHGHADRRIGGDDIRRDELADGEAVEPQGEADGQLDLRPGGGHREEAVI